MWDGFDHRKFPRLNLRCEIKIESPKNHKPISAKTENVGLGGICVMQEESLERFSRCKLRLELGGKNEAIECEGKVCWVIPRKDPQGRVTSFYDTGIEFLNLKLRDQKRLDEFIQSNVNKGFEEIF